ncbi:excitatory amino acid transporter 3-like [Xenia sp. Carnegie-2017]|uniref:excitatory amino acid transporter 3-like n=1 Tax=Xenia sp. Carnegie-2017 TaxID=2897299 RepID=UPI001F04F909|nr:excitatory amino acid transporter 3-like [Xenia sp. Carnegie-2017]
MSFVKENRRLNEDIDDVNESQLTKLESEGGMSFWKLLRFLIANKQFVAVIISVFLGFLIGIVLHDAVQKSDEPEKMVMYIKFPGELFIRMLRMIIIPLTISTIVVALAETDTGKAKKLGKYTFLYYLTTTIFATVLGITLIMIIKPGKDHTAKRDDEFNESSPISALDSFLDLLR